MLTQAWPSADEPDIHNLGVEFETIDADIAAHNVPKFRDDVTTLDADANVVRAELGLAAIKSDSFACCSLKLTVRSVHRCHILFD